MIYEHRKMKKDAPKAIIEPLAQAEKVVIQVPPRPLKAVALTDGKEVYQVDKMTRTSLDRVVKNPCEFPFTTIHRWLYEDQPAPKVRECSRCGRVERLTVIGGRSEWRGVKKGWTA